MRSFSFTKKMLIGYLLLLHILVAVLVLKTNFFLLVGKTLGVLPAEEFYPALYQTLFERAEMYHRSRSPKVALIGDSLSTQIPAAVLPDRTVNLAIGGLTTNGARRLLSILGQPQGEMSYILEVGVNDMKYRAPDIVLRDVKSLLEQLTDTSTVVLVGLLPVDTKNAEIINRPFLNNDIFRQMNNQLAGHCVRTGKCMFVNPTFLADDRGDLRTDYAAPDGWHLSASGAHELGKHMAKAFKAL